MPRSQSLRSLVIGRAPEPGPPSPTLSEATNVSGMNFGEGGPEKIITRANLKASIASYERLITSCANYRAALMTLSKATAGFADAMEICSGLKGPSYETSTKLQAASGLHHLMGNHWHVLAETYDREFEKPLRQHLAEYRAKVTERSASYEKQLHEKSRLIRQTEMRNMNPRERNMQRFREALVFLQRQVDELDDLKLRHYQEIVEHEEEVWSTVQGKVSIVVRSTMDIFDRFTSKASDPIIEQMLQAVPDPFDAYGPPPGDDQIFSILPPLAIIGPSPSPSPHSSAAPELGPADGPPVPFPGGSSSSLASLISPWARNAASPGGYFTASAAAGGGAAAWGGVSAGSSPATSPASSPPGPRSVSPPLGRRNSHPPAADAKPGHRLRKSESSKLRHTLSSIDESNGPRHEADDVKHARDTSAAALRKEANGWPVPSYTYGQTPYAGLAEEEKTPRNSALFAMPLPAGEVPSTGKDADGPEFDGQDKDPELNRSPLSDRTEVPLPS